MQQLTAKVAHFFYWLFHNIQTNQEVIIKKKPFYDLHLNSEGIIETTTGLLHQYSIAYYSFRHGDHWRDPEITFLVHIPFGKMEGTSPIYPCCFISDAGQVYEASIKVDAQNNLIVDIQKQKEHAIAAETFLELLLDRGYGEEV